MALLADHVLNVPTRQIKAVCAVSRLAGISAAIRKYEDVHGEYPPSLAVLVESGLTYPEMLHCPFLSHKTERGIDYAYVRGLRRGDPGNWLVVFDRPGNHPDGSRSVLYVSGRGASLSADEFADEYERFVGEFRRVRGAPPEIE